MKRAYIAQSSGSGRRVAVAFLFIAAAGGIMAGQSDAGVSNFNRCDQAPIGPAPAATVVAAVADGMDMRVAVHREAGGGSEEVLWVVARDGAGEAVAMAELPSVTADQPWVEVVLPGALDGVATRGLHYSLQIEDALGAVVGAPFGVLATLRCAQQDEPDVCDLSLVENVHIKGGLWISPALRTALDEVVAAGSEDILGDVMEQELALRGEVLTYAWQRQFLTAQLDPGPGQCECTWEATENASPAVLLPTGGVPWLGTVLNPGASHILFAHASGVPRQVIFTEQVSADVRLACGYVTAVNAIAIHVGSSTVRIAVPVLVGCPAPCSGTVNHHFTYRTRLNTKVVRSTTGGSLSVPPAKAKAFETVSLTTDGLPVLDQPYAVEAQIQNVGTVIKDCLYNRIGTSASRPQPSKAVVTIDAGLELEVEPTDYAHGRLAAVYSLWGDAHASCALVEHFNWGAPITILEKDILIGNGTNN